MFSGMKNHINYENGRLGLTESIKVPAALVPDLK